MDQNLPVYRTAQQLCSLIHSSSTAPVLPPGRILQLHRLLIDSSRMARTDHFMMACPRGLARADTLYDGVSRGLARTDALHDSVSRGLARTARDRKVILLRRRALYDPLCGEASSETRDRKVIRGLKKRILMYFKTRNHFMIDVLA